MPVAFSGDVVAAISHWTADGSRIVTEATVHTADGDVVVSQLGGTVDGLTMRQFPGPAPLEPGMVVSGSAHEAADLRGRMHTVVDDVQLIGATPDFVRTGPTKAGHYLFWESGCIFVTLDSAGTKAVPFASVQMVVDASIATWNTDTDTPSCSYMVVMQDAPEPKEVGKDGVNIIKFRDESWCRPAVDDDPPRCYNSAAAGITTAVFVNDKSSSRDGAIVDADIEINNVNFAVAVAGQSTNTTQSCQAELQNTLTHELGHLHGLEHTCTVTGDPPRVDGDGNPVLDCTDPALPQSAIDATMYPFQDCGETKKETLSDDDINAICVIYPVSEDPHDCSPAKLDGGGCCDASGSGQSALVLGLGTFVLLLRRRRVSFIS